MPVKVAIVGATGYAGGELARLLLRHPEVRLVAAVARGRQGEPLRDVQPHLHSAPPSLVVGADAGDAEVVFTALPAGEAAKLAPAWLAEGRRVIDIGSDFRLRDPKDYERWYSYTHPAPELLKEAVYGLTELTRSHLRGARVVANPGCYPTATLLALLPALRADLVEDDIVVDAKSGVSGAGRGGGDRLSFVSQTENATPYGVGGHRHEPEIAQELAELAGGTAPPLTFVPHLLPLDQGELVSCYVSPTRDVDTAEVRELYAARYAEEPFVEVVDRPPGVREVRDTNVCRIHVDRDAGGRILVFSVIDNLWKGAAGQAVQNLNLMLGLDEREGLS